MSDPAAVSTVDDAEHATPVEREVTLQEVLQMAQQAQRQERFDEAEAIYLHVLAQIPEEPNALNFFGVLRHQQGRHDEALALLERAVTRLPDQTGPWLNLANVLIESGYHDDAIKALNNVIALDPLAVMPHNNLGILHTRRDELEEAERSLKRALELGPKLAYVHYNLASVYFRMGRMPECAAHNLQAIAMRNVSGSAKARKLLSRALYISGEHERARQNLREWAEEEPDSPEPAHYLAAMGGAEVPGRASDAYVSRLFDQFADSFEVQLERLGYRAPPIVCGEVARLREQLPPQPVVLDAGCGTGLCGPLLRPLAARLDGVDLSEGMIARARPRQVYDALIHAELNAYLLEHPASYDVIASADVLIYFGNLEPIFAALAGALRPGGLLVGTLEALDDGDERDIVLQVHGRYAHRGAYVQSQLERHGLRIECLRREVLREELALPVSGWFFSAFKPS